MRKGTLFHIAPRPEGVGGQHDGVGAVPAAEATCSHRSTLAGPGRGDHGDEGGGDERLRPQLLPAPRRGGRGRAGPPSSRASANRSRASPLTTTKRQGRMRPWSGAVVAACSRVSISAASGPGSTRAAVLRRSSRAPSSSTWDGRRGRGSGELMGAVVDRGRVAPGQRLPTHGPASPTGARPGDQAAVRWLRWCSSAARAWRRRGRRGPWRCRDDRPRGSRRRCASRGSTGGRRSSCRAMPITMQEGV